MRKVANVLSDDGRSSIYAERVYKYRIKVFSFHYETGVWEEPVVLAESDFKARYPRLYKKLLQIEDAPQ
jgi:hypothetical protein